MLAREGTFLAFRQAVAALLQQSPGIRPARLNDCGTPAERDAERAVATQAQTGLIYGFRRTAQMKADKLLIRAAKAIISAGSRISMTSDSVASCSLFVPRLQ